MKKIFALSLVAAAALSLSACSKGADQTAAEGNEAVADINAATAEAIEDINAATAESLNAADAALDNAAAATEAAANVANAM